MRRQRTAWDPLELELQEFVSHHLVLETGPRFSESSQCS